MSGRGRMWRLLKIFGVRGAFFCCCAIPNGFVLAAPAVPASQSSPTQAKKFHLEDSPEGFRLRSLEEQVNSMKERIFRSKARLMLLRETILNSAIAGARARIVHTDEMGDSFVLEEATYSLDGEKILQKTSKEGQPAIADQIELFNGAIIPGNHNLAVNLVYRGSGFGVFNYLKGYVFRIKSSYVFSAEEGKLVTVRVVGYEKGGLTTDLKDRPAVRYDVEVRADSAAELPTSAAPATEAKTE